MSTGSGTGSSAEADTLLGNGPGLAAILHPLCDAVAFA